MTVATLAVWPIGAAVLSRLGRSIMDVILHIGAHRTATTTFQHMLRDHEGLLHHHGVAVWGPKTTRKSVFPGLFRNDIAVRRRNLAKRAQGRVQMHMAQAQNAGMSRLLVSDENLMGTPMQCLRYGVLYPAVGERLARVGAAFKGRISRIVLTIRAQDLWWASVAAFAVGRGHAAISEDKCDLIVLEPRTWRDVITDVACALPDAAILVHPFERIAGRPEVVFETAMRRPKLTDRSGRWLNRSPDIASLRHAMKIHGADTNRLAMSAGRWQPFSTAQARMLQDDYANDLNWLASGADGIATLIEEKPSARAEHHPPEALLNKGQDNDKGQGPLARDG